MNDAPSLTASNGRGTNGKFGPGNCYAKGNPFAKRVARLRSALLNTVKPSDLQEVITALLASAKGGDVAATRELLQRLLGPPQAIDLMERMNALEQRLTQLTDQGVRR